MIAKLTDVNQHTHQLITKHLTDQNTVRADKLTRKIDEVEAQLSSLKHASKGADVKDKTIKVKMSKLESKLDGLQLKLERHKSSEIEIDQIQDDAFF